MTGPLRALVVPIPAGGPPPAPLVVRRVVVARLVVPLLDGGAVGLLVGHGPEQVEAVPLSTVGLGLGLRLLLEALDLLLEANALGGELHLGHLLRHGEVDPHVTDPDVVCPAPNLLPEHRQRLLDLGVDLQISLSLSPLLSPRK